MGAAVRVDGRNKQAGHRYHYEFGYERPDSQRERPNNAYVVEIDPNVTEPLRTIAPTFCVIADNLFVDRSRS